MSSEKELEFSEKKYREQKTFSIFFFFFKFLLNHKKQRVKKGFLGFLFLFSVDIIAFERREIKYSKLISHSKRWYITLRSLPKQHHTHYFFFFFVFYLIVFIWFWFNSFYFNLVLIILFFVFLLRIMDGLTWTHQRGAQRNHGYNPWLINFFRIFIVFLFSVYLLFGWCVF